MNDGPEQAGQDPPGTDDGGKKLAEALNRNPAYEGALDRDVKHLLDQLRREEMEALSQFFGSHPVSKAGT